MRFSCVCGASVCDQKGLKRHKKTCKALKIILSLQKRLRSNGILCAAAEGAEDDESALIEEDRAVVSHNTDMRFTPAVFGRESTQHICAHELHSVLLKLESGAQHFILLKHFGSSTVEAPAENANLRFLDAKSVYIQVFRGTWEFVDKHIVAVELFQTAYTQIVNLAKAHPLMQEACLAFEQANVCYWHGLQDGESAGVRKWKVLERALFAMLLNQNAPLPGGTSAVPHSTADDAYIYLKEAVQLTTDLQMVWGNYYKIGYTQCQPELRKVDGQAATQSVTVRYWILPQQQGRAVERKIHSKLSLLAPYNMKHNADLVGNCVIHQAECYALKGSSKEHAELFFCSVLQRIIDESVGTYVRPVHAE